MHPRLAHAAGILLVCAPAMVSAHSFGRVYNLPVPFWLYAWGAAAALVASFLVVAYFVTAHPQEGSEAPRDLSGSFWLLWARRLQLINVLKVISVSGLFLCMLTGWIGSKNPYANFNMTFFWVVFVLGFTYFTAAAGDLYSAINPWRVIAATLGRLSRRYVSGIISYPTWLGHWPALMFYMAFIWLELFGPSGPSSLAMLLASYSVINLLGVGLVGMRDWFRYCEFFGVFLRLIAGMAPVDYEPASDGKTNSRLILRRPFSGLLAHKAESMGILVFVLFMLSSTAFDGLRETLIWKQLFWVDLYHAGLKEWVGHNPLAAFPAMTRLFTIWQSFWLLLSPVIYLAVYMLFVALAKWMTRSGLSIRQLALEFALPLLPIALVYNITHYYTLVQTQGFKIVSLVSDPFGWGWNLFGTADWLQFTVIPEPGTVWHVQVFLIVLGHIISVYLSHRVALRLFPGRWLALVSQLPMLVLMVVFTTAGLWILSQPMQ